MAERASKVARTAPRWRTALPWVFATAIAAYVALSVNVRDVGALLVAVNVPVYFGFVAAFSAVNLLLDSLALSHVYRAIGANERLRSIIVVRGASYLPAIVNFHVGQAYLTYLVAKNQRMSILAVARGTLLSYATTLGATVAIAAASLPLLPLAHAARVTQMIAALAGAGVLYLVILALRPHALAERPLLQRLFEVGPWGHVRLLLWRLPHIGGLVLATWVNYAFFGVRIPVVAALGQIPLVLLISSLPITPQGIGTRELLAIQLFAPFAPGISDPRAAVVAAGAAWTVATLVTQTVVGLVFTRPAAALLNRAGARQDLSGVPRIEGEVDVDERGL
jgi:hypothetical protein